MTVESTQVKVNDWRNSRLLLGVLVAVLVGLLAFGNWRFGAYLGDWDSSDMMLIWLAGRGLIEGYDIYSPEDWETLHADTGSDYRDNPIFLYPFPAAFLFLPFGILPLEPSGVLWLLLSEALYIACGWYLLRGTALIRDSRGALAAMLALALFQPFILVLWFVQYGVIMLALVTGAVALTRQNTRLADILAGVCWTLMLFRPNPVVVLLPAVLLWQGWHRRWWIIVGSVVSGLILLGLAELVRPGWIPVWLEFTVFDEGKLLSHGPISPTLRGVLWLFAPGLPSATELVVLGILSAAVVAVGVGLLWRSGDWEIGAVVAVFTAVTLIVTPYSFQYDHVLLVFPMLWALARAESAGATNRWIGWVVAGLLLVVLPVAIKLAVNDLVVEYRVELLLPLMTLVYVGWALLIPAQRSGIEPIGAHAPPTGL